jgi:hypothetical protein
MEEMENISFLNANNMVLQTITWQEHCDFHQGTGGICQASMTCPDQPGAAKSCCGNNFSFE